MKKIISIIFIIIFFLSIMSTKSFAFYKKYSLLESEKLKIDTHFSEVSILDSNLELSLQKVTLNLFLEENEVINPSFIANLICRYTTDWKEMKLLAAIVILESHGKYWDSNEDSGAIGLFGIMPAWRGVLKIPGSLKDPDVNIQYAIKILNIHIQDAKGEIWGHKGGIWYYNHSMTYVKTVERLYKQLEILS